MDDLIKANQEQLKQTQADRGFAAKHRDARRRAMGTATTFAGFDGDVPMVQRLGDEPVPAKEIITNGAIGLGEPVIMRGNRVDALQRVRVAQPTTPVTATGRIKYLYTTPSETGRDLYVGGYQAEPTLIGPVTASDRIIRFTNLGGDDWLLDLLNLVDGVSSRFIARDSTSDLYTSRLLTGVDNSLARQALLFGTHHSFVSLTQVPESEGGVYKYIKAFQGEVEVGDASTAADNTPILYHLLPALSYIAEPNAILRFQTAAINSTGTVGVGIYGPAAFFNRVPTSKVAWFDADTASTHLTDVTIQFPAFSDRVDCFDDRYTVFPLSPSTVAVPDNTIDVTLKTYGPDAIMLDTEDLEVYTIPTGQQLNAVVLDASYSPD